MGLSPVSLAAAPEVGRGLRGAGDMDEDGRVVAVAEHGRLAAGQAGQRCHLAGAHGHRAGEDLAVSLVDDPVGDLQVGVLDHVRGELGRYLVDHHDPLPVGADLGEQVGEGLDRLGPGGVVAGAAGIHVGQQPVGLLDDQHVPKRVAARMIRYLRRVAGRGGTRPAG